MVRADNLGITNFNLVGNLQKRLLYKDIYLKNDAKCAAICEKEYGNLKGYDNALFICLGTGIGGAIFIEGKMIKLKYYNGFEIRAYGNRKTGKRVCLWK